MDHRSNYKSLPSKQVAARELHVNTRVCKPAPASGTRGKNLTRDEIQLWVQLPVHILFAKCKKKV